MATICEVALRVRLEQAQADAAVDKRHIADLMDDLKRARHEIDSLRAKVEVMERQEPEGWR